MSHALIAQATQEYIMIGLYDKTTCKVQKKIHKHEAGAHLIIEIAALLKMLKLSCDDISYVGASLGPAPFTALRILIATLNGIAFAHTIPLVGVDGLKTFYMSTKTTHYPHTVILLNAYGHEAYFAYNEIQDCIVTGCDNIILQLKSINDIMPTGVIRFIGSGATLFCEHIQQIIGERAYLPHPMIEHPTLDAIAHQAHIQFNAHSTVTQLTPIYLKRLVSYT
jgi:tRNA threonylcarbamoyl adenosine modification protein YeaZ